MSEILGKRAVVRTICSFRVAMKQNIRKADQVQGQVRMTNLNDQIRKVT